MDMPINSLDMSNIATAAGRRYKAYQAAKAPIISSSPSWASLIASSKIHERLLVRPVAAVQRIQCKS